MVKKKITRIIIARAEQQIKLVFSPFLFSGIRVKKKKTNEKRQCHNIYIIIVGKKKIGSTTVHDGVHLEYELRPIYPRINGGGGGGGGTCLSTGS